MGWIFARHYFEAPAARPRSLRQVEEGYGRVLRIGTVLVRCRRRRRRRLLAALAAGRGARRCHRLPWLLRDHLLVCARRRHRLELLRSTAFPVRVDESWRQFR